MAARIIGKTSEGFSIYYGTVAERLALPSNLEAGIQFLQSDGSRWEANGAGGWNKISGSTTNPNPPFHAPLFNGLAAGSSTTDQLQDYSDWTFQVAGVAATNDIMTIYGSLAGGQFDALQVMNIATGAVTTAITTAGIYKLAVAANTGIKPMSFQALKATKTGTTPALTTTVDAFGGWAV